MKHLSKYYWAYLAALALFLCIDIEFEWILIHSCSTINGKAVNNIILALSYSYIAASIFHYVVNVLPHNRRMHLIKPLLNDNLSKLSESIRLSKEVIIPFAAVSNIVYDKEEYAKMFENANLHEDVYYSKEKSILNYLEELRLNIRDLSFLILSYREYLDDEQYQYICNIQKSLFISQGIRPYPDIDVKYRKDYYGSNQYEIGESIYDLYEYSKKIEQDNMKQINIISLLTIIMCMVGAKTFAHDIEVANSEGKTIYYYINSDGCSLRVTYQGTSPSSYSNEYTGEIVIPETVTYSGKTYSVTRITPFAFEGCSGMTSLTIPNSITSIENYAFRGCSGLISVTIPNKMIDIESDAFLETAWYNNQPDGLVYAGNIAYKYKGNMPANTSITLKEGTIAIAAEAFLGCGGLTSVSIPNSVVNIGADAFSETAWYNNKPDGLVYAGNVAYKYKGTMPDNTSITLKEGTVGIASKAFSGCSGLTSVTIPNSVTSIGALAFSGCKGLASVSIPDNVTNISHGAFANCSNITSIIIPNSITRINSDVFSNCYGLTSVIIPNSVTIIEREAFQDCYNLTSVNIPNSVISISYEAFENCSELTSLIIPNSVTYIDRTAFWGCKKLSSLYCLWENPIPINSTVFSDETFQTCTLYVPKGTKEKYQNTEAWKSFSVINEFTPSEIENKEVNVILSSAGYATFYNAYNNFKIPVGLSAQVITFDSYGNLSYNTIANGIIPKGIPVILKSNDKKGGTYTLTSSTESTTYSGENLLHGSSSQTMTSNVNGVSTTGNSSYVYYKLAYGKSGSVNANKFGWYWGVNNGAAFSIEGGKAWLALPMTNAQSKRAVLFIDDDMSIDDATSIDDIEQSCNNEANSIQYNMAGQRVDNSYNGIIIVNGKKIVR